MQLTRLDNAHLREVVQKALKELVKVSGILDGVLVHLTDEQRATVPRARDGFQGAGGTLAAFLEQRPLLVAAVEEYHPAAVLEDLANAAALAPLVDVLATLQQRLNDSGLVWTGEAWEPSLAMYDLAKGRTKNDPELAKAINGMATIFRKNRKKPMTKSEKVAKDAARRLAKKLAKAKAVLSTTG